MPEDIEALKRSKYYIEQLQMTVDFTTRLRSGQAIVSVSATAADVNGVDVSSALILSTSAVSPMANVILKASGGTIGQVYKVKVIATCTTDVLEQLVYLDIK